MADDENGITDQDEVELQIMVERMTLPQIVETLEDLAKREKGLLSNKTVSEDEELKEITLWNFATLCAAIGKFQEIIQAHIEKPDIETSEDPLEEHLAPEEE
jgi:hypothetical protein